MNGEASLHSKGPSAKTRKGFNVAGCPIHGANLRKILWMDAYTHTHTHIYIYIYNAPRKSLLGEETGFIVSF